MIKKTIEYPYDKAKDTLSQKTKVYILGILIYQEMKTIRTIP
jgi:hypothetical protein